jgi:hypothetical protein
MKNKSFDCVEMKRKGAEMVQQRVASLPKAQQLEYWRQGTMTLKQEMMVSGPRTATSFGMQSVAAL